MLVADASKGIGRGTAIELGTNICQKLFLIDRDATGLAETKRQLLEANPTTNVETHVADIANESSVKQMIDACVGVFGRVDYAVNVAGVVPNRMAIADVPVETYDKIINVNEYGVSLEPQASLGYDLVSNRQSIRRGFVIKRRFVKWSHKSL